MLVFRRRDFIAALGGAAAWPLAARAQQPLPVIGYLGPGSAAGNVARLPPFKQGLSETGHVEGQNIVLEYRYAGNQYDRLPALAADLVRRKPVVIFAFGLSAAQAVQAHTATIPIVFRM